MKRYDYYLFDFDGTLVDSHDALVNVFKDAYKSINVDVPDEDILYLMRCPLIEGYQKYHGTDEQVPIFVEALLAAIDNVEYLKLTKIYDDVLPTLNKLKNLGYTLGIVTSNSTKHVNDVLGFLNINPKMFDVCIGSDICNKNKPDPTTILMAMEQLGVKDYDKVVYIGDSVNDANAAVNAHIDHLLIDRLGEYKDSKFNLIYSLEELL